MMQPYDYRRSSVNPIAALPAYDGELGVSLTDNGTGFTFWAPTAETVTLRLFATGSDAEPNARRIGEYAMTRGECGTWQVTLSERLVGVYYDIVLQFPDGSVNRSADPWAHASGINGERSMVVDLGATNPEGWDDDRGPDIPDGELVVWETHIGDFSNDPDCGVPPEHRGRFLAFTHDGTYLAGHPDVPTCLSYLKRLGVTCVQLLPFYDYGSVDEARPESRQYNWGYDPVNYNVPEGSYSTDPFHGEVRIRECKTMIQALHRAGCKVIMDVVYNHMYSADNWYERMVPGYFCRRTDKGALANGSGCGDDMASEHEMFRRAIVDSVTYWAREYHIDGFRFDLMGLIDIETMNAVRAAVDMLPGGERILLYGEPWSAATTAAEPDTVLADKTGVSLLNRRVGWFCDATRDTIKGHIMHAELGGFVNGRATAFAPSVRLSENAWRDAVPEPKDSMQLVQYVSAHDDLTLWDKLCATMCPDGPLAADYNADADSDSPGRHHGDVCDMLAANAMAAGLTLTAAGLPFMLSGEEFARTKCGCSNSFDRSAELNQLDWRRSKRLASLVSWYRTLIRFRRSHPNLCREMHVPLQSAAEVVATRAGELIFAANAGYDDAELRVLSDGNWTCVIDSSAVLGEGNAAVAHDARLTLPARSFTVWSWTSA